MHRFAAAALLATGSALAQNTEPLGMTWGTNTNASTKDGVVFVSCHGSPKSPEGSCNAYRGDTACSTAMPVLCLKRDGRKRPVGLITTEAGPSAAMPKEFYAGWAGGVVALTPPVRGSLFADQAAADAYCARSLGDGWRMAEFHDGIVERTPSPMDPAGQVPPPASGGWAFYANGAVSQSRRFWVAINDQPANCWNSAGADSESPNVAPQKIAPGK